MRLLWKTWQKLCLMFDFKNTPGLALLNVVFILYVWRLLQWCDGMFKHRHRPEGWGMSEFLINYQGGFVRRGLYGEILHFLARRHALPIEPTVRYTCIVCFIAVCLFFLVAFCRRRYALYILPLCLFLGSGILGNFIIRKDYMFMSFFLLAFALYTRSRIPMAIRLLGINVLLVFIILSHESVGFFSLPLLLLLQLRHYRAAHGVLRSAATALLGLLPSVAAFAAVTLKHGDRDTAQAIWDSWKPLFPFEMRHTMGDTIESLTWPTKYAFARHIHINFLAVSDNISSLLAWLILLFLVYYIASNFLYVFRKDDDHFTLRHKTLLSSVLVFQFACLLPLFILLSNDYIRVCFYLTASTYAIFILMPADKLEAAFPPMYLRAVERLNRYAAKMLCPTRTTLALLMLCIGISAWGFSVDRHYHTTVVYHVLDLLSAPLRNFFAQFPKPPGV